MSKSQMIELIRSQNPSASSEFLVDFNEQQLDHYLRRLTCLKGTRGRTSGWTREAETPAVVGRRISRLA